MQTGRPLKLLPDEMVSLTAEQIERDIDLFADEHFTALSRVLNENPQHHFVF